MQRGMHLNQAIEYWDNTLTMIHSYGGLDRPGASLVLHRVRPEGTVLVTRNMVDTRVEEWRADGFSGAVPAIEEKS